MGNNGQIPALPVGREVQGRHRQQSTDLLSLREIRRVGAKWASQLAQFDFDIQYKPGKINPVDALSRMPLEPSPEPLLTVVPPEVATVNDLQCKQLAVDPTPTAGVLGDTIAPMLPLDKEEEPDQTAVPEAATELLPRLWLTCSSYSNRIHSLAQGSQLSCSKCFVCLCIFQHRHCFLVGVKI